jgi:hypothetical protein
VLRISVSFRGQNAAGRDTIYTPAFLNPMATSQASNIALPPYIVSTTVTALIELCDCKNCETTIGEGRCVNYAIDFTVPPPPAPTGTNSLQPVDRPGPGSSAAVSRSTQP